MHVKKCRICKNTQLKKIFSLGKQPLANNLLNKKGKARMYPLELLQCSHCTLIQLSYVVPKEELFDNYFYIPSISKTYLKHFDTLSQSLIDRLQLEENSLVVDIGSSDGSLLECFKEKGMNVLGVEPAQNIDASVPTIREYFTPKTALAIVEYTGKAKLVTATNVFAHIDNLDEFIEALNILLDEDGVFFAQFPDVRNLLQENQFDTIYHEHLSYFTYEPLHHLFANSPFELFKIDSTNIHGGSMQILIKRREPLLSRFAMNVVEIKMRLSNYLTLEKMNKKKIVAFGAAAKGIVLLNYCGLDNAVIDYIADGTPYKQGKYAPGVNIPIVPEEMILEDPPDIILILAWNFKNEIMEKLKGKGFTFVIPVPFVQILGE